MGFENDTNRGRVQKMIETLHLISKSAQSNRASEDEVNEMIRPLLDELDLLGAVAAPRDASQGGIITPPLKKPAWADVREMAEQADLKDLLVALAVFMNRVDEALDDLDLAGTDGSHDA